MKHMLAIFTILILLTSCGEDATGPEQGEEGWQTVTAEGISFGWRVMGDSLEVELTGPTTGWVAAGFDPESMMNGSNLIIGYVSGGTVSVRDDWGTSQTQHESDVSLGGTDDVTVDGGSESDGETTIEFTIPLDSGDQYDRPLQEGDTYSVILAIGSDGADDFTSYHQTAAVVSLDI